MRKWRRLAAAFVAMAATLTVVTVATQTAASASDSNPTFITVPFGTVSQARAYNLTAAGAINIVPSSDAKCSKGQTKDKFAAELNVPGIAKITGLEAQCSVNLSGSRALSWAKVADVDLFNGRIKIKSLESLCVRANGYATIGSTYGSLVTDQNYSTNGTGAIVIPGIATVAVDVNTTGNSHVSSALIVITLLNQQAVVISACSLTHQSLLG
jgi:hypothetical protein